MRAGVVLLLLLLPALVAAQAAPPPVDTARPDTTAADTVSAVQDTLRPDTLHVDTTGSRQRASDTILYVPPRSIERVTVTDTANSERHLIQKPTAALFKSLLIPGWGQLGNHRPLKALLFAGLEVWFAGEAIHYGRQAANYRRLYDQTPKTNYNLRDDYYGLYRDRADRRNKFLWFTGTTVFISIFDAYVDAQLSGAPFGKDRSLSLRIKPTGAALALNF